MLGLGLGATARNKKDKNTYFHGVGLRKQTIKKWVACQMVLSAMEKNKTGIGLCVRDIFTEKAISELSYWRGYLGEECGWTMDQQV